MAKRGFTLVELLIVIIIIAILAALLLPSLARAICAAKEAKCQDLIGNLENACKMYERDYNAYPVSMGGDPFPTGPAVNVLAQPGPKRQPYMDFGPGDVSVFPISGTSDLVNPIQSTLIIHYRNNTMSPPPGGSVPMHNRYSVDIWAQNCMSIATGINNWRLSQ